MNEEHNFNIGHPDNLGNFSHTHYDLVIQLIVTFTIILSFN